GRILDLEGRPIVGATVLLHHVSDQAPPLLSLGIEGYAAPPAGRPALPLLPGFVVSGEWSVHTDADGRFRIAGIGKERTATLQVSGEGIARSSIQVVTRLQAIES